MKKVRVITDSASDISFEDEDKYNIRILPFKVAMGAKSYLSRVDFNNEEFYQLMDQFDGIPITSQITPYEFETIYEEEKEAGNDSIILILINSEGSATFNNAKIAKENFYDAHPEWKDHFKIHLFDSANYCSGYGYIALKAAQMIQNKVSEENVLSFVSTAIKKSTIYFGMYTLKYASKSGRIPSAAAFVGEALNLKPIMKIYDHKITTVAKAHGEKKLITGVLEKTLNDIEEKSPYCIIYGTDREVGEILAKRLESHLGYPPEYFFQIGAAISINAGPKVVGVSFFKKEK